MQRSELFEAVWKEPAFIVAARLGIAHTSFRAVCRKHGIPLPDRRYWNRKRAGLHVDIPPLHGDDLELSLPPSTPRTHPTALRAPEVKVAAPVALNSPTPTGSTETHQRESMPVAAGIPADLDLEILRLSAKDWTKHRELLQFLAELASIAAGLASPEREVAVAEVARIFVALREVDPVKTALRRLCSNGC